MHIGVFCDFQNRLIGKYAVVESHRPAAFYTDFYIFSTIKMIKLNTLGLLHQNIGEEQLAIGKYIARLRAYDLDANSLIVVRMVEGTGNTAAMGIILGLSLTVIDQVTQGISIEAAANEYIVATIVDATV